MLAPSLTSCITLSTGTWYKHFHNWQLLLDSRLCIQIQTGYSLYNDIQLVVAVLPIVESDAGLFALSWNGVYFKYVLCWNTFLLLAVEILHLLEQEVYCN